MDEKRKIIDEKMPEELANPNATPYDEIDDGVLARTLIPELRMWGGQTTEDPFNPDQMLMLACILVELGVPEDLLTRATALFARKKEERKDSAKVLPAGIR
jgi:hypothetical protein